jgi:hypothetical protein
MLFSVSPYGITYHIPSSSKPCFDLDTDSAIIYVHHASCITSRNYSILGKLAAFIRQSNSFINIIINKCALITHTFSFRVLETR